MPRRIPRRHGGSQGRRSYDLGVATVVFGITIFLLPFPVVLAVVTGPSGGDQAGVFLPDIPLALLVLMQFPHLRPAAARGVPPLVWGWLVLLALMLISFALHPSVLGAQFILRFVAIAAVAFAFARLDPRGERATVAVLVATALIQAGIAMAQIVHGGPLGLDWLGEWQVPFDIRDHRSAPRGTTVHEYSITVLVVLATALAIRVARREAHPERWIVPAAAALVAAAFTFSRAALLGVLALLAASAIGAWRGERASRIALAALSLVLVIGAAATGDEWLARIFPAPNDDPEHVACGRVVLVVSGLTIAASAPVFGVGPDRYVGVLHELRGPGAFERCLMTPHDLPLLFAAEDGALAGILLAALIIALGVRAVRSGPLAAAIYVVLLPSLVVDDWPFHVHGMVLTGMWLGALERAAREKEPWRSGPRAVA